MVGSGGGGRVVVGGFIMPFSVRDVLVDGLTVPKAQNTLGVGTLYRGSKLDHFRSYASNGTFKTFSACAQALEKAWKKTLEDMGHPEHLTAITPHKELLTQLVEKETELGAPAMRQNMANVLTELGWEVTPNELTKAPERKSTERKRKQAEAAQDHSYSGVAGAEVLWHLAQGGAEGPGDEETTSPAHKTAKTDSRTALMAAVAEARKRPLTHVTLLDAAAAWPGPGSSVAPPPPLEQFAFVGAAGAAKAAAAAAAAAMAAAAALQQEQQEPSKQQHKSTCSTASPTADGMQRSDGDVGQGEAGTATADATAVMMGEVFGGHKVEEGPDAIELAALRGHQVISTPWTFHDSAKLAVLRALRALKDARTSLLMMDLGSVAAQLAAQAALAAVQADAEEAAAVSAAAEAGKAGAAGAGQGAGAEQGAEAAAGTSQVDTGAAATEAEAWAGAAKPTGAELEVGDEQEAVMARTQAEAETRAESEAAAEAEAAEVQATDGCGLGSQLPSASLAELQEAVASQHGFCISDDVMAGFLAWLGGEVTLGLGVRFAPDTSCITFA